MFINRIFTKIHKSYDKLIPNNVIRHFSINRNKINTVIFTSKRNLSLSTWRKPNIEKLRLNDNIPKNYDLVYRCTMGTYLYAAQISATVGVAMVVGIALANYFTDTKSNFLITLTDVKLFNLIHSDTQMIVFSIGFILINIAVMRLVSKFPIRMYFNAENKKYIGVLYGKVPKTKNVIEFNAGELVYTPKSQILPWGDFRYQLKDGKKLIIFDHYFRKPEDMNIMLGYTKM